MTKKKKPIVVNSSNKSFESDALRSEDMLEIFKKAKELSSNNSEEIDSESFINEEKEKAKELSKGSNFIGLNGIKVHSDGQMSKVQYLDKLNIQEEDYNNIQLTEDQARNISRRVSLMTTGVNSAIPMKCTGPMCAFVRTCPYAMENKAPIGLTCILEIELIKFWTDQFLTEFDVDMNNLTEIYLVSELAEFNIYEMRITKYLAEKHPTLMQDVVVSVDERGVEIVNQEVSRAFDLKERIKKSRMKVLESLMATRKERTKLDISNNTGNTAAEKMSDLKTKLEDLKRDMVKMHPAKGEIVKDGQTKD